MDWLKLKDAEALLLNEVERIKLNDAEALLLNETD